LDFLYLPITHSLFEVFRLCVRYAAWFERSVRLRGPGLVPRAVPPHCETASGASCWNFLLRFSVWLLSRGSITSLGSEQFARCVPDDGECVSISGSAGNKHL
jgi:hypothetical protein